MNKKEIHQAITENIIRAMDQDTVPWRQDWSGGFSFPIRFETMRPYRGINVLHLMASARGRYSSPFWLTPRMVGKAGGHISARDQNKLDEVIFWKVLELNRSNPKKDRLVDPKEPEAPVWDADNPFADDESDEPDLTPEDEKVQQQTEAEKPNFFGPEIKLEKEKIPFIMVSYSYNGDLVKGSPKLEMLHQKLDELRASYTHDPIASCEKILADAKEWLPPIIHRANNMDVTCASYNLTSDEIRIPPINRFKNPESYYYVLFHEIGHSTRHPSRLNRKGSDGVFGSVEYAKEELVAEITAWFLANQAGIVGKVDWDNVADLSETEKNSIAYIQAWKSRLRDDPGLIIAASQKADKAYRFVLAGPDFEQKIESSESQIAGIDLDELKKRKAEIFGIDDERAAQVAKVLNAGKEPDAVSKPAQPVQSVRPERKRKGGVRF